MSDTILHICLKVVSQQILSFFDLHWNYGFLSLNKLIHHLINFGNLVIILRHDLLYLSRSK